jgi:hypothetical protein
VVKVDLATNTRVSALTLNADEDTVVTAITDGTYGYSRVGARGGVLVEGPGHHRQQPVSPQ